MDSEEGYLIFTHTHPYTGAHRYICTQSLYSQGESSIFLGLSDTSQSFWPLPGSCTSHLRPAGPFLPLLSHLYWPSCPPFEDAICPCRSGSRGHKVCPFPSLASSKNKTNKKGLLQRQLPPWETILGPVSVISL